MPTQSQRAQVPLQEDASIVLDGQPGEKLKFSERRYRSLFESAQDGILILDAATGRIDDANPFFKKLLGYSESELLGRELWEIGVFKNIEDSKIAFVDLQNKEYIHYNDLQLHTKNGDVVDVEFVSNIYTAEGQRVIQCNIRDITERKKIEEAERSKTQDLKEFSKSQEEAKKAMLNIMEDLEKAKVRIEIEKVKDEAMLASIGEGLIAVDNDSKIMIINKVAEEMLGWSAKEYIGKKLTCIPLEDEEGNPIPLDKGPIAAIPIDKIINNTRFFVKKDKTRFPIAITVTPIKLGEKIIGAVNMFRDISREKEIDRAKSEFVSLASHQLRTPLGISKWYIEALMGEGYLDASPKIAKEYLNEVYKSNERLLSLVRDLLSISRIDQGKVRDAPKLTDITELIKQIIKAMSILAVKNSVTIRLDLKTTDIPLVLIDPSKVQEVVENLIGNAITYSKSGETVEVIIDIHDDALIVKIKDTGIGISKEDQEKLFTKFFRSQKATIKNTEGSGLGLYVVKSYVDGWGGSISVKSAEGKGSTFSITLPLMSESKTKNYINVMDKKFILIGEDEYAYGRILKKILEKEGYDVVAVLNGEDLLTMARQRSTALIVLDLIMPVKNGFQVLAEMKQDEQLKHIKVITLTNSDQKEDIERAKELGTDEYIIKSDETIYNLIHKIKVLFDKSSDIPTKGTALS